MFAESRTSFEDAETSLHRHEFDDEIFILFNAWCEGASNSLENLTFVEFVI